MSMIVYQKPWERPLLPPVPDKTNELGNAVLHLGGDATWRMTDAPMGNFWLSPQSWPHAEVPMDRSAAAATGGAVTQDPTDNQSGAGSGGGACAWQCELRVPVKWAGCRVLLRFLGAGCQTSLWVDGVSAGSHYGCFTSWDCDVTSLVTPGGVSVLTVCAEDCPGELSPYQAGGILRDVLLLALPQNHLLRLDAEPVFEGESVSLRVCVKLCSQQETRLSLRLITPGGGECPPAVLALAPNGEAEASLPINEPLLWDSEHPHLYTLTAELTGADTLEVISRAVGLRRIEIDGEKLLVNNQPVKLRGLARHESGAFGGKSLTRERMEREVALYREANVNFIRCAHYPPDEYFLELCDRQGIYVQDEAPMAYVDWRLPATQNDPKRYERYMGQFAELVERDRTHPSVLIWGLGSDCSWGSNFRAEYQYVKAQDPSRPVLFNYPMTMREDEPLPDIWSVHCADPALDLGEPLDHMIIGHTQGSDEAPGYALGRARGVRLPVLHDEFAMPACYNRDEQKRDPAVREFWGESISRFAEKLWATPAALGGAVWCAIDETNLLAGGSEDNEWGVLDPWLRKKPEYHHLKKAYTPVKIAQDSFEIPEDGVLKIPVENRFNHSDLNELTVFWQADGKAGELEVPPVKPGQKGWLELCRGWRPGTMLTLSFICRGLTVEERRLKIGVETKKIKQNPAGTPEITETADAFALTCGESRYIFGKGDGLLKTGGIAGEAVMIGGPRLQMTGLRLPKWRLISIEPDEPENGVGLRVRGAYGEAAEVSFQISLNPCGELKTKYTIDKLALPMPRRVKANVGLDCGGLDELGVCYDLAPSCTTLCWEREGIWREYPEGHIGRTCGTAKAVGGQAPAFGEEPQNLWGADMVSYGLYGKYDLPLRGTNDFRSMKHHIIRASCGNGRTAMEVLSDGTEAVRAELLPLDEAMIDDRDPAIRYCGNWYATHDASGCWRDTETISKTAGDWMEYKFIGTGICWYGASDMIYGMADLYMDGEKQAAGLSMYAEAAEKPGFSRGYEKRYERLLYAVNGLPLGEHTLRILVTGKKEPQAQNTYVSIDALRVLNGPRDWGGVRLLVCGAYNYTRLAWGNYMKPPIHVGAGETGTITTRLVRTDRKDW